MVIHFQKPQRISRVSCLRRNSSKCRPLIRRLSAYNRENRNAEEAKLISLTQKLLDCISEKDFMTYKLLVSENVTCLEPESRGTLVQGIRFHKFYFELENDPSQTINQTICQPNVQMLGSEAAVVSYICLKQLKDENGVQTIKTEETRVWQLVKGAWILVHFHKTLARD